MASTRPRWLVIVLLLLPVWSAHAQVVRPLPNSQAYTRAERLGFTFVNSVDTFEDAEARYRAALSIGAGWTRWPLYWSGVETAPGAFNWARYDRLVDADIRHGLRVNLILLGRPGFRASGGSIAGINNPVFADGTDIPGPGKPINLDNPWAVFVSAAVNRYRPGGLLASQRGWGPGQGITHWEAWNEPDFAPFWSGGVAEYARLLKVTYLAVKNSQPDGQVLFAGLAYGNPEANDYHEGVLHVFSTDPNRARYNWYHDIMAVHAYSYARRTGLVVERVNATQARYGLGKPVWVNESGVPVWDDYPGPTWAANDPGARALRATMDQQANYILQSTAYAWAAGADVVLIHQLYDDCGNTGGNHAYGSEGAGDAYGIYRNGTGYGCYSQHPRPNSPRPAAAAFELLAELMGNRRFEEASAGRYRDGSTRVIFQAGTERYTVLWNNTFSQQTIEIPAEGRGAQIHAPGGQVISLAPVAGGGTPTPNATAPDLTPEPAQVYRVVLPPAEPDNVPDLPAGEVSGIGGPAFILVERVAPNSQPETFPLASTPRFPITITPGALVAQPTAEPANDTQPPNTDVDTLPVVSEPAFTVRWRAWDDGAIEKMMVWVRVDGGEWQPWLETSRTEAVYTGAPGHTYEFAVWAVDAAGNWSLNTDLQPQAVTRVE